MAILTHRRLEHDLYWGYRLFLLRGKYAAKGFRGKAKDQGFKAYLAEQKISARHAYRLIERYLRFARMYVAIHVRNEDCEPDSTPFPESCPEWLNGHMTMTQVMSRKRRDAMRDKDSVPNDEAARAEDCRTELDSIAEPEEWETVVERALDAIGDSDCVTNVEATS